jgi:hypothetical protein
MERVELAAACRKPKSPFAREAHYGIEALLSLSLLQGLH